MALIEVHHVVASQVPVDPAQDTVSNPIIEGRFVGLETSGYADPSPAITSVFGLAGDSAAADSGYTPYAADLVVNSRGATRSTSNRVSDMFDETLASGYVTVYHSGGEFWTDQIVSANPFAPGAPVYTNTSGQLTTVDGGSARQVGVCMTGIEDYPSGVPGTDVQGSITLGSFVRFVLTI